MEIWDAYYRDGTKTGTKLIRGEKIPQGKYHMASEVLVQHRDGTFLCLRRSYTKEKYAGYYETTIRGYVQQGEDPVECIERELKEKLCIQAFDLREINVVVSEEKQTIYHVFTCMTSCNHDMVQIPKEEAFRYKWFTKEEFRSRIKYCHILPSQYFHFFNEFIELGIVDSIAKSDIYNKPVEVISTKFFREGYRNEYGVSLSVNQGYINGIIAEDGAQIRAYIVGIDTPVSIYNGIVIGVVTYLNGMPSKLIVGPEKTLYTQDQIREIVSYNERTDDYIVTMK